jgi:hypothetical protein
VNVVSEISPVAPKTPDDDRNDRRLRRSVLVAQGLASLLTILQRLRDMVGM